MTQIGFKLGHADHIQHQYSAQLFITNMYLDTHFSFHQNEDNTLFLLTCELVNICTISKSRILKLKIACPG